MGDTITSDKIIEAQFISLIMMIQDSAMYGLGKLINPMTQKVERNLAQAKIAIDMLEMISQKTKGNLNDNEKRFVETTLTQLRLNYVEESGEDKKDDEGQKEPAKASEGKNEKQ